MNVKPTSKQAPTQQIAPTRTPQNESIKNNATPENQKQESSKAQTKDTIRVSSVGKQALQGVQDKKTQATQEARGDDIETKKMAAKETVEKAISQKAATPKESDVDKLLR
jgi:hypothetical protein